MTNAFEPGDPVLELATLGKGIVHTVLEEDDQAWIRRAEQLKIDEVSTFWSNIVLIRTTVPAVSYFLEHENPLSSGGSCTARPLPRRCNTNSKRSPRLSMVHIADIIISSLAKKARGSPRCYWMPCRKWVGRASLCLKRTQTLKFFVYD